MKKLLWRTFCAAAVLLTALAFTPWIIPPGRFQPWLAGLPFSLWTGILLSVALVVLTFLGTLVHPARWPRNDQ